MIGMSDLQHPVELFISCRGLKKMDTFGTSDPKVKVMMKRQGQWVTVGETEIVKNTLDPDFKTTIVVDYAFEVVQPLRFDIIDYDAVGRNDYHGSAETTLGEVIGAPKQTESLSIFARGGNIEGKLIVRADKNELSHNVIFWQWSGYNLMNLAGCMGKSSPFLKFYKQKQDGWFAIHETEVVTKNLNPNWQLFKVNDDKLCGSVHDRPIKIECLAKQNGKNSLIGACEVTLEKLKKGETTFTLTNPTSLKTTGTIKAETFAVQARQSFIDFIRGGEQLHSIVAIDFTASNGDPKTENSLHARLPNGALNDYQQAIMNVCGIIQYYDKQKQFPVFGFGARPKYEEGVNQRKVSHCFPCSGVEGKSEVAGIQGILDIYQFALDNVELQGPTHFAPIIEEAMKVCQVHKDNDADVYTIFLILTDGEIHDIKETVDLLVKAAHLPLSIIMVGLGPADFAKMEMFDAGKELVGSNNEKCARSLVQFVPFRNFKNDMVELTKRVLAQIPEQLVDYKALVNKTPKPPLF